MRAAHLIENPDFYLETHGKKSGFYHVGAWRLLLQLKSFELPVLLNFSG